MIVSRQRPLRSRPPSNLGWINFVIDAVKTLKASDDSHYRTAPPPTVPDVDPLVWAAIGVGGIVLIGGLAYALKT